MTAATLVSAAGVVALALGATTDGGLRTGLAAALDLWTAAGLLQLTASAGWDTLATAAVIVGIRHVARVRRPPDPRPA